MELIELELVLELERLNYWSPRQDQGKFHSISALLTAKASELSFYWELRSTNTTRDL